MKIINCLASIKTKPWIIVLIILIAYSLLFVQAYFKPFTKDRIVDTWSYYFASKALIQGENIYDAKTIEELAPSNLGPVYPYLYPPILAMLWTPMLFFSPVTTYNIFLAINLFLTGINGLILWRLFGADKKGLDWFLIFFIAFHVIFGPLVSTLRLGQINIFLGSLIFLSLYLQSRGKEIFASFLLSLAILIKITPAVFVLYYIVQRRWRPIISIFLFSLGICLISIALIGFKPWIDFIERAIQPMPFKPIITLKTLVITITEQLHLNGNIGLMIFIFIIGLLLTRVVARLIKMKREYIEPIEAWSLLTLFSFLIFPLTWHHHYYLGILPFMFMFIRSFRQHQEWQKWVWLVLTLCALFRYPGTLHFLKPISSLIGLILI